MTFWLLLATAAGALWAAWAAQKTARATKQLVAHGYRPILVLVESKEPQMYSLVAVAIKNIGNGPALQVRGDFVTSGRIGEEPVPPRHHNIFAACIEAGREEFLRNLDKELPHTLNVRYSDIGNKRLRTYEQVRAGLNPSAVGVQRPALMVDVCHFDGSAKFHITPWEYCKYWLLTERPLSRTLTKEIDLAPWNTWTEFEFEIWRGR